MISEWKACLAGNAAQWGMPESGDWRFLLYNNYHPHCSDMDLFWFHNGGTYPRAVTKILREPTRGEREFANLRQVYAFASEWVPRPLHFGPQGRFWTLWMEGVPGAPFQGSLTPEVLQSMTAAVSGIHRALIGTAVKSEGRWQRVVAAPLESLAAFGDAAAVREGCDRIRARASAEWLDGVPEIPQHGDLYAGNLLVDGDRWRVVDWEGFGLTDLPAYDLYTLLLSLLRPDGHGPAEWNARLMQQMPSLVEAYGKRIGLAAGDMPVLLTLTLANWFYLQWRDGRTEFSERLYRTIQDHFEHEASWERVFFSA